MLLLVKLVFVKLSGTVESVSQGRLLIRHKHMGKSPQKIRLIELDVDVVTHKLLAVIILVIVDAINDPAGRRPQEDEYVLDLLPKR